MFMIADTDAARSSLARFNDSRCIAESVCPMDSLLFSCVVIDTVSAEIKVEFLNTDLVWTLNQHNMVTEPEQAPGVTVQSMSVTENENTPPLNYSLVLLIANASVLNGSVRCNTGVVDPPSVELECLVPGTPTSPTDLRYSILDGPELSAVIQWQPPGGSGMSCDYIYILNVSNGQNASLNGDDLNYTISGINYNTNITVKVTAVNLCGVKSEPATRTFNIAA